MFPLFWVILLLCLLVPALITNVILAKRLKESLKQRSRLEKRLDRALCRTREYAHLQSLGKSTCGLVHDLKNQLMAVSGHAALLSKTDQVDKREALVERLNGIVSRVENFANKLLEFSKSVSLPDKHPLRLSVLLHQCVELNFPGRQADFHFGEIPENEELMQADACQLDRAFANLFRNCLEAGATRVEIGLKASQGKIRVYIEDNGRGCSREDLPRLPMAFYTTKKNQGGSGLGLSVAQDIIERHCGDIRLYSKNSTGENETGLIQVVQFQIGDETPPLSLPRRKRSDGYVRMV